jgi:GNAT superfamily N-acetyltransferase
MRLSDMSELMRLKEEAGWNQTQEDWTVLIEYKNSINLVALIDKRIAGTITAISYDNKVVWIGMVIVDKKYRGRGISKKLLNEAVRSFKDGTAIKLDATPAGKRVYEKLGFVTERRIVRMVCADKKQPPAFSEELSAVQARPEDLPFIIQRDETIFGANRQGLINYLFNNKPDLAWVIKKNGTITSFCLGRKGTNYTQIGPLYAASDLEAKVLITNALNEVKNSKVVVDSGMDKKEWGAFLVKIGFKEQRDFERMYLKRNPFPGIVEKQYLIAGPEFA